jgi:hypothetical protein
MLEADTDFATLVPSGKCKKYGGGAEIEGWLENISETDLPEVALWWKGGFFQAQQDSSGSSPELYWSHVVATGQRGLWRALDATWYIYEAWSKWESHLKTLTWNSKQLVWLARLGKATVHEPGEWPQVERGINGWAVEIPGTTYVTVATSDIQA